MGGRPGPAAWPGFTRRSSRRRTPMRMDRAIFGRGYFSMAWVRIGADRERLHVRVLNSLQGGGSFSVPLDDVSATPDRYGWMALMPTRSGCVSPARRRS